MLTGVHIIMTYKCTLECDHCFVHAGPYAQGVTPWSRIRRLLGEARGLKGVEWIYFEGGEPLLFYPVLLEGLKLVKRMGFKTGIVTNAYGAVSAEDAKLWLEPLARIGIDCLNISDDQFHYEEDESPAKTAVAAARELGIPVEPICVGKPYVEAKPGEGLHKGSPVIGGGAMFRGRAVDKLIEGLPRRPWREFTKCPYEELVNPQRVHVDPYGHVHLCQGVSMGNAWERPLPELVSSYEASKHPVAGPLVRGGPAELAREYGVELGDAFVDECHFCYLVRRELIGSFPECLTPPQVYGL